MPTWATIIISFILGISGALLTVLANEFTFKPILIINKSDDKFYYYKTRLCHHRFIVLNEGMRVANNCMTSLTIYDIEQVNVNEPDNKTILSPDNFSEKPITLSFMSPHWAGTDSYR